MDDRAQLAVDRSPFYPAVPAHYLQLPINQHTVFCTLMQLFTSIAEVNEVSSTRDRQVLFRTCLPDYFISSKSRRGPQIKRFCSTLTLLMNIHHEPRVLRKVLRTSVLR